MGAEAEKPIQPGKSSETKKPSDPFAATRSFERFLSTDLNALKPDQKGSYYSQELIEFRRIQVPIEFDPEEGTVIATITTNLASGKVTIQRHGEPPIEV